jgi:hypothetical protein
MTVYDSLHSLLDHERLLFHCDEWRTTNQCSQIELLLISDFSYEWRMLSIYEWILFYKFQAARM